MELDDIIKTVETQALDLAKAWQTQQPIPQNTNTPILELTCPNHKEVFECEWATLTDIFHDQENKGFLQEAYRQLFGREVDESGLNYYLQKLSNRYPRSFVLLELLKSEEVSQNFEIHGTRFVWISKKLTGIFSRLRLAFISNALKSYWIKWENKQRKKMQTQQHYQQKLLNQYRQLTVQHAEHYSVLTQELLTNQTELYNKIECLEKKVFSTLADSEEKVFSTLADSEEKVFSTLADSEEKVFSTLADSEEKVFSTLANSEEKLVEQIFQSQVMAQQVDHNYSLLQHKLNYHQNTLSSLIDDLSVNNIDETKLKILQAHQQDKLDAYYVAFEDANRGTREEIRDKQIPYINRIQSLREKYPEILALPVLDVGCGRGEWMQLLEENGVKALGVDMNPVMVDDCQSIGLNATHCDAVEFLRNQADNSLAVITGFHIIEHLPFEVLFELFAEAYRALAPNGQIIFETPNPENILVGSHTFYHDFTHRNPVTPSAIQFLAKYHNYINIELIRLHPYPPEARISGSDPLTERVNGHLTGPQDFAILAQKPEVSEL